MRSQVTIESLINRLNRETQLEWIENEMIKIVLWNKPSVLTVCINDPNLYENRYFFFFFFFNVSFLAIIIEHL